MIRKIITAIAIVVVAVLLFLPKPWDAAQPDRTIDYVAIYGWWAGAINATFLFVLAATTPLWSGNERPLSHWFPCPPRPSAGFWVVVLASCLLCSATAFPRLGQSLWDDEENSARRLVAGKFKLKDDGQWRFRTPKWGETIWNYDRPTNHHLQTILSRLSLNTAMLVTPRNTSPINEAAMRLPALVAGLAALLAMAGLLWRLGFERAGAFSALAMGLHPWFLRYASEMRGYSLTILFLLLAGISLIAALQCGRWKWWWALAACWFLMLYSFPGTIFVAIFLWLVSLAGIILRNGPETVVPQIARWLVTSLVVGMLYLQLMLPCIPQVFGFMESVMGGTLTPRWHANLAAHFFSGIPWNNTDLANTGYPELKWIAESSPLLHSVTFYSLCTLGIIGLVRLALRRRVGWMIATMWTLPPLASYWTARLRNEYLYEWYLIFALPGVIATIILGMDFLVQQLSRLKALRPLPPLLFSTPILGLILAYAFLTQPARSRLVQSPLQPMREAVVLARGSANPFTARDDILTAQIATRLELYDPRIQRPLSLHDLKNLVSKARHQGQDLYVISGNQWALSASAPEITNYLSDPAQFQLIAELKGMDPTLTQKVYLLK